MRKSTTTSAPPNDTPAYGDHPPQELAREIEHLSADGTPAHPEVGPGRITLMLVALCIVIVLVGLGTGLWLGPLAGITIGGLGLALFVVSPAFWAGVLRARQRAEAKRQLDEQQRASRTEPRQPDDG